MFIDPLNYVQLNKLFLITYYYSNELLYYYEELQDNWAGESAPMPIYNSIPSSDNKIKKWKIFLVEVEERNNIYALYIIL